MTLRDILRAGGALVIAGTLLFAQKKQPAPKSKAEYEAFMAIQNAADPDSRIKAVDDFLTKYADTELKAFALTVAAESARQKNDFERMVIYAERVLETDKDSYTAMLMLASGIAQRTREHDLDREEKLGRAEKYAQQAIKLIQTAEKLNPQIPDDQWAAAKKDFEAQAHESLGIAAVVRKKYDEALKHFQTAAGLSPDPALYVRMASAYNASGKPDEAIAVLDKLNAAPDLHPAIKQIAQNERNTAIKAKAAKK